MGISQALPAELFSLLVSESYFGDSVRQELDEEERAKITRLLKDQEEDEAMTRQKVEEERKRQEEI